jgi:hypothetical protein
MDSHENLYTYFTEKKYVIMTVALPVTRHFGRPPSLPNVFCGDTDDSDEYLIVFEWLHMQINLFGFQSPHIVKET